MWACGQPAWWRWTISSRPWTVSRALRVGHENLRVDVGLRQATPHPEVLLRSSQLACHQRPGRVHLDGSERPTASRGRPDIGALISATPSLPLPGNSSREHARTDGCGRHPSLRITSNCQAHESRQHLSGAVKRIPRGLERKPPHRESDRFTASQHGTPSDGASTEPTRGDVPSSPALVTAAAACHGLRRPSSPMARRWQGR